VYVHVAARLRTQQANDGANVPIAVSIYRMRMLSDVSVAELDEQPSDDEFEMEFNAEDNFAGAGDDGGNY